MYPASVIIITLLLRRTLQHPDEYWSKRI